MSDKEERGFLGIFFKSQPEPEPEPVKPKRRKARKPDTSVIDGLKAEIAELRDMITNNSDTEGFEPSSGEGDDEDSE